MKNIIALFGKLNPGQEHGGFDAIETLFTKLDKCEDARLLTT